MTTTRPVRDGRRYRRAIIVLVAIGIASLLAGMAVDRSLVGLVVYAVAVVGAVGATLLVRFGSSVALGDERERELERRASNITFHLFGYLGLFAFIALFLLEATGRYTFGPAVETLLYAYATISLTWGGIYVLLRYRL